MSYDPEEAKIPQKEIDQTCEHVRVVAQMINMYGLNISQDDYGTRQIWCKKCDKGVTW